MARKDHYDYDDDDEEEPWCYGDEWENGDPSCDDCSFEMRCRRKFLTQHKKKQRSKVAKKTRTIEDEALDEAESYDGLVDRMPRDGEHWVERVAKNSAAGMLSAFGREIMLFFRKWRW